jgi:hypothetical protein
MMDILDSEQPEARCESVRCSIYKKEAVHHSLVLYWVLFIRVRAPPQQEAVGSEAADQQTGWPIRGRPSVTGTLQPVHRITRP